MELMKHTETIKNIPGDIVTPAYKISILNGNRWLTKRGQSYRIPSG